MAVLLTLIILQKLLSYFVVLTIMYIVSIELMFPFSGDLRSAGLDYDLKTWLPGNTITVDTSAYVPSDLPTGTYEVTRHSC